MDDGDIAFGSVEDGSAISGRFGLVGGLLLVFVFGQPGNGSIRIHDMIVGLGRPVIRLVTMIGKVGVLVQRRVGVGNLVLGCPTLVRVMAIGKHLATESIVVTSLVNSGLLGGLSGGYGAGDGRGIGLRGLGSDVVTVSIFGLLDILAIFGLVDIFAVLGLVDIIAVLALVDIFTVVGLIDVVAIVAAFMVMVLSCGIVGTVDGSDGVCDLRRRWVDARDHGRDGYRGRWVAPSSDGRLEREKSEVFLVMGM